jgi:pyrroline-5-carboxylate reductase
VEQLFDSLGGTLIIDDAETLNAIQTTTATISTHLHYLAAVAAWLTERGIDPADAEGYVRSMFLGVADGLDDRTRTLPELANAHETPGGLNEQLRRRWFTELSRAAFTQELDEIYAHLTK